MKLDKETIEWVESHSKLIDDIRKAESLVQYGKIILVYQNSKYIGMDACPRKRI